MEGVCRRMNADNQPEHEPAFRIGRRASRQAYPRGAWVR
ncbi:DUF1534 domain-containing protein, partial [Pseudomonas syringae]|nr:DUF1534 domain-containing protein [Pseudomonas syringae]